MCFATSPRQSKDYIPEFSSAFSVHGSSYIFISPIVRAYDWFPILRNYISLVQETMACLKLYATYSLFFH